MTFQGYLDTIHAKTGLTADDFVRLATDRGLVGQHSKAGDVISWLAADYRLGRGHAMAIVAVLKQAPSATAASDTVDPVETLFSGPRHVWWASYTKLLASAESLGRDVGTHPTKKYVGFTRAGRKFAIVAPTTHRLDVGLKLNHGATIPGTVPAGSWNAMVTHRAQLTAPGGVDDHLLSLLAAAYSARSTTRPAGA